MAMKKNKKPDQLLKRGNVGLIRLLIAVNESGSDGISTFKLLQKLGSTNHAQAFIKRAAEQGYISRNTGKAAKRGQFVPVYNTITPKGQDLIMSLIF
jgi:hypothetical protein